jgi:hypothetical protein
MKIILKADRLTLENNNAVVRLTPELAEPRSGDAVSGELFLTTIEEDMVINKGDIFEIDFTEEPGEPPVEG